MTTNQGELESLGIESRTGWFAANPDVIGSGLPGQRHGKTIRCSECGIGQLVCVKSNTPVDVVANRFKRDGWRVSGPRKNLCPSCHKGPRRPEFDEEPPLPSPVIVMPNKPVPRPPAPSDAPTLEPALQRRMMVLLDKHFDPELGIYAVGWNDAAVAREIGVAPDAAGHFRRTFFGPINAPTAFDELAATVEVVAMEAGDLLAKAQAGEASARAAYPGEIARIRAEAKAALADAKAAFDLAREQFDAAVERIQNDVAVRLANVEHDFQGIAKQCQAAAEMAQGALSEIAALKGEMGDGPGNDTWKEHGIAAE